MNEPNDIFNIPTIPKNYQKPVNNPENTLNNDLTIDPNVPIDSVDISQTTVNNPEVPITPDASSETDLSSLMYSDNIGQESTNPELNSVNESPSNIIDNALNVTDSNSSSEDIAPFVNPNPDTDSLNNNINSLPDSLDQNYGVINPEEEPVMTDEKPEIKEEKPVDNKETNTDPKKDEAPKDPKKEKSKKPKKEKPVKEKKESKSGAKKIIVLSLVSVVLLLFGIFGFLAYRYYFSLNPVKSFGNLIKEFGNNANSFIQSDESVKFLKNEDLLSYKANIDLKNNDDAYNVNVEGVIEKPSNNLSARISVVNNGSSLFGINAIMLNNTAFLRLQDKGHYYRLTSTNEINIDDFIDGIDLKKTADNAASVIEKKISKNDFSSRVMRIKPDDKVIIVNKYSLKLSGSKIKEIIKEIINTESNPNMRALLQNIDYRSIPEKVMDIDIYLSLKKIEKIDINYNGHFLIIVFNSDGTYTIKRDSNTMNLKMSDKSLDLRINDKDSITLKSDSSSDENGVKSTITYIKESGDNTTEINYSHELVADPNIHASIPYNIKDLGDEEGQILFKNELQEVFLTDNFLSSLIK